MSGAIAFLNTEERERFKEAAKGLEEQPVKRPRYDPNRSGSNFCVLPSTR